MRIHFGRVGEFAGIRLKEDVDTDTLPPEEAKAWQALVEKRLNYPIHQSSGADSRTSDSFEYWGTVEDGGNSPSYDRRNAATLGNSSD
jgi:hypothetical protein